ncbi:Fc.00g008930.m01.CDS01 [Cosmosporella sp. VM-42]
MARLRSSKYLTCFYCGKRTNTKYDGVTHDFLCLNCDATNYLDENGDITDPPVATEREAPARHYAVQRQQSPTSPTSSQDNTFCSTCLKNQRLFTASLAQYLPDDPSDPSYPELERNYYRYRKSLEERYPQVCEECAERVEGKIRQAGYTAKTDHLRRMVERSRGRRVDPAKTTATDWVNTLGRGLWWGGFLMQILWHMKVIASVLKHTDDGMYDPDDKSWPTIAISGLEWVVAFLPPPDTLIIGAITSSILSIWWNPQFVQFSRGFTKHLLGFTQWYSFQWLIIFFRVLFRRVEVVEGGKGDTRNAQLGVHFIMAVIMGVVYTLARRSIRVDTTPLFGPHSTTVSPKPKRLSKKKQEDSKTFSDLLNEALDSPTSAPKRDPLNRPFASSLPPPYPPSNPIRSQESPSLRLESLGISPPASQRTQEAQYSDEMDWSPTQSHAQSQHRAFADPPSNRPTRAFGEAPVHPEGSPFWYKIPAAPSSQAQRLRSPNVPVLRSKPVEKESVFFTSKIQAKRQERSEDDPVAFNQPRFFAPERGNDEANSLADLLDQSFSLGQERDQPSQSSVQSPSRWKGPTRSASSVNLRSPRAIEASILAAFLALWLLTISLSIHFGRELQLAILSGAGIIALHVTGNTSRDMREGQAPSTATYVGSVLSVVELAVVCWLGWEVWQREVEAGMYGVGILAAMLGHQVWNTIM